jgi:hypothetical protein
MQSALSSSSRALRHARVRCIHGNGAWPAHPPSPSVLCQAASHAPPTCHLPLSLLCAGPGLGVGHPTRPLSPHITIYTFKENMISSVLFRGTGMAMTFGALGRGVLGCTHPALLSTARAASTHSSQHSHPHPHSQALVAMPLPTPSWAPPGSTLWPPCRPTQCSMPL